MPRLCAVLLAGLCFAANAAATELPEQSLATLTPAASEPGADAARPGSLLAGRTVGDGANVIHAQFGWPGVSVGYLHGMAANLDLGAALSFNYGFEGTPNDLDPGVKLQGTVRLSLFDSNTFNVGLRLDPGLALYFRDQTQVGIVTPLALLFGFSARPDIMVNFGFEVPLGFFTSPNVEVTVPVLLAVGLEYHVDSHLSVTFSTAFGPEVQVLQYENRTAFSFQALAGIGYRL